MKLQQLRFLREITRHGFNISAAAATLNTSQPALSQQIRSLEQELGIDILERRGNRIVGLTTPGERIAATADRIVADADGLKRMAADFSQGLDGRLIVAATHTQARYALRDAIVAFKGLYPGVDLKLRQGNPLEIAHLVSMGEADISVGTEPTEPVSDVVLLPCHKLPRMLLMPSGHALAQGQAVTLKEMARHPIIAYEPSFRARRAVDEAFERAGLVPRVVISAIDADVMKRYVHAGLGVAILPHLVFDPRADVGLSAIDVSHLIEPCTAVIAVHARNYLRSYAFDFISIFSPHWQRGTIAQRRRAFNADEG